MQNRRLIYQLPPLVSRAGDPLASTTTVGVNVGLIWFPIPAIGLYDKLLLESVFSCSVEGNTKSLKMYYCPTNGSIAGASDMGSTGQTTFASTRHHIGLRGLGSTNRVKFTNMASANGTADIITTINLTVPWFLCIVANITTAGTVNLMEMNVQHIKGGA